MKRMLLLILVLLAGCVQETQTDCVESIDCHAKGEPAIQCVGEWECVDGTCIYECETQLEETPEEKPLEIVIVRFSPDKGEYGSSEWARFTVEINSTHEADANVTVRGIKPGNWYFIEEWETATLEEGINVFLLNATTPRCTSGCGGVNAGDYEMEAEVRVNGTVMAEAKTVIALHS